MRRFSRSRVSLARASERSPSWCPNRSLTCLKWSRSPITTLSFRPPRRARSSSSSNASSKPRRFSSPVSASVRAASASPPTVRSTWRRRAKISTHATIRAPSVSSHSSGAWSGLCAALCSDERVPTERERHLRERRAAAEEVAGEQDHPQVEERMRGRRRAAEVDADGDQHRCQRRDPGVGPGSDARMTEQHHQRGAECDARLWPAFRPRRPRDAEAWRAPQASASRPPRTATRSPAPSWRGVRGRRACRLRYAVAASLQGEWRSPFPKPTSRLPSMAYGLDKP